METKSMNHSARWIYNDTDMPHGLRIVMLGDSLMRYQYLSLVYFLRHRHWWNPDVRYHQFTVEKAGFRDWGEYFALTNAVLYPFEYCDCFRGSVTTTTENRYFFDTDNDNEIIVHLALGHSNTFHGKWISRDLREFKDTALPPQKPFIHRVMEQKHWRWEEKSWGDVIRNQIAHYHPKPTHIVLNAGLWPNNFTFDETVRKDLTDALRDMGVISIWKTTTHKREHQPGFFDYDFCYAMDLCLNNSWTAQVSSEWYWDDVHFWEPIYRAQNEDLLEMIGYEFPPYYQKVKKDDYFVKKL